MSSCATRQPRAEGEHCVRRFLAGPNKSQHEQRKKDETGGLGQAQAVLVGCPRVELAMGYPSLLVAGPHLGLGPVRIWNNWVQENQRVYKMDFSPRLGRVPSDHRHVSAPDSRQMYRWTFSPGLLPHSCSGHTCFEMTVILIFTQPSGLRWWNPYCILELSCAHCFSFGAGLVILNCSM